MVRTLLMCLAGFLFVNTSVLAQERTVSGRVTSSEDGSSLPGVNVTLKGTTNGTVTDVDGNYTLQVAGDGTLVFSFIGLKSQEVEIGSRVSIDVQMQPDVTQLSEVVVTGYKSFTQEKSNIAATSINADRIQNRPNPSVIQTLQGQIPGLSITTTTGQPGAASAINIRGVSSINGSTEPLFVIDGAPVDGANFRSLNPNEIESVTVLKDAGATAIYGNRGANGVIVIQTKGGRFDSPLEITYSYQRSQSELQNNKYDLMSSPEQLRLERLYGSGLGTTLTDAEMDATSTFDWADYFFNWGVASNHNLQIRRGGANSAAYISMGFLDQEGILQNSALERYNVRANVDGRSDNKKFTYGVNLSLNYSSNDEPNAIGTSGINQNYVLGAYQAVPYISDADYVDAPSLLSPLSFTNTPLFLIDRLKTYSRTEDEFKMVGTVRMGYEIINGLNVNFRSSLDYQTETLLGSQAPDAFNSLLFAETGNNTPGFQDQQYTRTALYNQVASANYERAFGKHTFNLGIYSEYFKAYFYTFGFRQNGLNGKTFYPGDGSGFVGDNSANDYFIDTANANIAEAGLFSYFGQLDWDFDTRFGLTGTLRRDASSRFARSNRWGTFFSVSGRWNLHNESFFDGLPFNVMKLRASYGTNGNQEIDGSSRFTALDFTRSLFATGAGYGGANGISLAQIGNLDLRWETVAQANIGLDFEMMDGRFNASIDGYVKTTTDLFQEQPVSAVTSTSLLSANVGTLENRGVDVLLGYSLIRSDEMNLKLNVVGNYNKSELTELPGGEEELIGTGRIGGLLYEYYDYLFAGVNPSNGNLLYYTKDGEVTENPNVDTDRVWTGKNIYPEYQGSFGLDFDFKGFFATVQFNYAVGVDRYDYDLAGFQDPTSIGQFRSTRDLLRAWTPENRNTDIPSLNATNISLDGTRYLKNADYLRLRFASVGYSLPKTLISKARMRMARVFVNAENLVTFSEWRGFDPEALSNTNRLYPTPRVVTFGIELGI